jgi:hypothetical protein
MAEKVKPIVKGKYLLHKYPGKGGWTYAVIPGLRDKVKSQSGWIRADAIIEGKKVGQVTLAPMKNSDAFMPFRTELRKIIGCEAGDTVSIILYGEDRSLSAPEDFMMCLREEPGAMRAFESLGDSQKRTLIKRITLAKTTDLRVERMAEAIRSLTRK